MAYLKLIRAKNLVIVAITQLLLQFLVVYPYHAESDSQPVLDTFHFFLLVLATVLIAAGGYVINDLKDIEIDKINKPDEQIIGNSISEKEAKYLYLLSIIIGTFIAVYMSIWVERPLWFLLFPISVFMLWSYSAYFKKSYLVGNIIVSFFAAGVATMMREIVKDIEDLEGDKKEGAKTFPIIEGIKKSKFLASIWGGLLAFGLVFFLWVLYDQGHVLPLIFGFLFVLIPILYSIFKLYKSQTINDFGRVSQFLKVIMLAGLCFLIFIVKVNF